MSSCENFVPPNFRPCGTTHKYVTALEVRGPRPTSFATQSRVPPRDGDTSGDPSSVSCLRSCDARPSPREGTIDESREVIERSRKVKGAVFAFVSGPSRERRLRRGTRRALEHQRCHTSRWAPAVAADFVHLGSVVSRRYEGEEVRKYRVRTSVRFFASRHMGRHRVGVGVLDCLAGGSVLTA